MPPFAPRARGALALCVVLLASACGRPSTTTLTIYGKTFTLDTALDPEKRFRGLSNRAEIPADGGMLFIFPDRQVKVQGFVMRDCAQPIDIIYLDKDEKITAWHTMPPEAPRAADEQQLAPPFEKAPEWSHVNAKYEARLKQHSSIYAAKYAIELRGEATKGLPLKVGDHIDVPDELRTWVQ